jgi:hypothetical protein
MKPMVLTQEAKDNALEIFKKLLETASDNADLKINITTETLMQQQGVQKPTVYILATAYCKMRALIDSSNDELAWYGTASRVNNNYFIENILVYPQTVTAATVDADEEKCAKWFMELPDDVINSIRFQGHSHVTMSASPSGRDTNNWQQFGNLLKPDEFMILCIGNKRGEFYWNIYDKAINVFFENKDITTCVVDEKGNSINDWAKESIDKHIVKETPRVYSQTGFYNNTASAKGQPIKVHTGSPATPKYSTTPSVATDNTNEDNDYYEKMISYIPADLAGDVDYIPEADIYFTYMVNLPDFYFSNLYDCHICRGERFRQLHPKKTKRGPGRPKKDKKNK